MFNRYDMTNWNGSLDMCYLKSSRQGDAEARKCQSSPKTSPGVSPGRFKVCKIMATDIWNVPAPDMFKSFQSSWKSKQRVLDSKQMMQAWESGLKLPVGRTACPSPKLLKNFSKEKKIRVLSGKVHLPTQINSWNTGINTSYSLQNNELWPPFHEKLIYEDFQIDFHVQQRKKLAVDYLSIQGYSSFPPLFSCLSERTRHKNRTFLP